MISKILHLLKVLIWITVGTFLIWFSVVNHTSIFISFYPFGYGLDIPPWGLLFVGIFIGLITAGMATGFYRITSFISNRKITRQRDQLQKDNHILSEQAHTANAELFHQRVNTAVDPDLSKFKPKPYEDKPFQEASSAPNRAPEGRPGSW